MAAFYAIESIKLKDYDGNTQVCPVSLIMPLFRRTESRAPRFIEDKWLDWCNRLYGHKFTNIKLVIKYI